MEKLRKKRQAKGTVQPRMPQPDFIVTPGWDAALEGSLDPGAALSPRDATDATSMSCKSFHSHSHLVPGAAFMTDVTANPLGIKQDNASSEAERKVSLGSPLS